MEIRKPVPWCEIEDPSHALSDGVKPDNGQDADGDGNELKPQTG